MEETIIVLATYDDERDALQAMYKQARILRSRRQTKRYGVFMEPRKGTYWVCLKDRGPQ